MEDGSFSRALARPSLQPLTQKLSLTPRALEVFSDSVGLELQGCEIAECADGLLLLTEWITCIMSHTWSNSVLRLFD